MVFLVDIEQTVCYLKSMNQRRYRTKGLPRPLDLDTNFYTEYDYNVVVEIRVSHKKVHRNIGDTEEDAEAPGRYYELECKPEALVHSESDRENNIRKSMDYWLNPKKESLNADRYTIGFVLVRRAYATAKEALGLTDQDVNRTFTSQDVLTAYPWISQQTLNHRIQQKFVTLKHPAKGKGSRHEFSLAELVHVAVVDEIASLGVFTDLSRVSARKVW